MSRVATLFDVYILYKGIYIQENKEHWAESGLFIRIQKTKKFL